MLLGEKNPLSGARMPRRQIEVVFSCPADKNELQPQGPVPETKRGRDPALAGVADTGLRA
jgi:hypothetical protein